MFERILLRTYKSRALAPIGFFVQFFALKSLGVFLSPKNIVNVSENGDKRVLANLFLTLSVTTNSKFIIMCLQMFLRLFLMSTNNVVPVSE